MKPSTSATTSTRQLWASSDTAPSMRAKASGASTNCAAPMTKLVPSKLAPLHFLAEEKGTTRSTQGSRRSVLA